jgi:opacity protein-like surface antigen
MKKLATLALVAVTSLVGALGVDWYGSISGGAAGENVGQKTPYFNYLIQAQPVMSPEEIAMGLTSSYHEYEVIVRGRDLLGFKLNVTGGAVLADIYRIEAELSFAEDRMKLTHDCEGLQRCDSQILKRRAHGAMINLGGYFPGWYDFQPYSLVGGGLLHVADQFGGSTYKFCYQWVTGIEAPLSEKTSLFIHHKYRKAFRASSLHCAEIGLKFSV